MELQVGIEPTMMVLQTIALTAWLLKLGGKTGIRTLGGVTLFGFQDQRHRPLGHLSKFLIF